jgi:hypothetical protein
MVVGSTTTGRLEGRGSTVAGITGDWIRRMLSQKQRDPGSVCP